DGEGAMTVSAVPVRSDVDVSRAISRGRGFSARRDPLFDLSMSTVDRWGVGVSRRVSRGRGFWAAPDPLFDLSMSTVDRCGVGACAFGAGGNCALRTPGGRWAGPPCAAGGGCGAAVT